MPKVNVLHVITKLELGGAQKQLLSLLSSLDKETFTPFLFTAKNGILVEEALSIPGLTVKLSNFLERKINPLKDCLALLEISSFIRKNNITVVHTHSSKAGTLGRCAAKLAGVKIVVHTVHGWSFNDYQPYFWRKFIIWLERKLAGFTNKIIVVSNHDLWRGLKNHIGEIDKYCLIYYGIDYDKFSVKDNTVKNELGFTSSDIVVGNISCFKPQKSPQDFVKLAYSVARVLPGIKFLLVGDGILRGDIEKLILRFNLQDQLILTGWRKDIPRLFSAIDIFALTSLWEGMPITVLEAMAAAKPVVVTHTGGVAEIVSNGSNGFLAPVGNIKNMAEKLILLLKDEPLRRAMAENTKILLGEGFRTENLVKETQDLYRGLIYAQ